jgi:formylglycine-generating enzyme required for sulfatase activity/serine/threonine protein kinase
MSADALGLVGRTISEKYNVERVVGEGGFAIVYRAEHTLWKRPVALKVFNALSDLTPELREQLTQDFIREGALLAELSEKTASICQARDVGVLTTGAGNSVPYMVLEWLEGETLEDAMQREQSARERLRSLHETISLLEPIAGALALAHARGIAHRDIKPANIFLLGGARDESCPVKLLDFGIAKVVQTIQKSGGAFTQTGGTVRSFTPAYAAPEQFSRSHGATGPWTDVFALALVAVELLTGKPPLDGESFVQLGFAAADPKVRPTPRQRGAETSDAVEQVFLRALAVERADRYASADAFWRDLRAAAALPASPTFEGLRTAGPDRDVADALGKTALARQEPAATPLRALGATNPVVAPRPTPLWVFGLGVPLFGAVVVGLWKVLSAPPAQVPLTAASAAPSAASAPAASVARAAPSASSAAPAGPCPEGMTLIPGGPFFMGSDDGMATEKPAHKVKVAPYCMDVTEVTTAKYAACSDGGWCKRAAVTNVGEGLLPAEQGAYDKLCNERDVEGHGSHPINCVTWEMADVYCKSHKARLPTEAEWEFAARGSDGRPYPWGDAPPSARLLNACGTECAAWAASANLTALKPMYDEDDHWATTAPVGSFPEGKSKFGVLDLAGNVWEWVSDWQGPYAAGDGVTPLVDPTGPATGTRKVIRGGAWNGSEPSWERPSFRYSKEPADRNYAIGFRCASNPM